METRILAVLILLFCLSCTTTNRSSPYQLQDLSYLNVAATKPIAILGVNVIPMDANGVLENMIVLIDDGRITNLSGYDDFPISDLKSKYQLIDGNNKYLIPGLIDAHIHLGYRVGPQEAYLELPLFVANGVTTVRNMSGTPLILAIKHQIESNQLAGPGIFTTGPIYNGASVYKGKNNSDWCFRDNKPEKCALKTPEFAKYRVQQDKKLGYDAIKPREYLTREVYISLYREAQRVNMSLVGHYPLAIGYEEMFSKRYQRSIEHTTGLGHLFQSDDFPFKGNSMDEMVFTALGFRYLYAKKKEKEDFFKAFAKSEIFYVPTLVPHKLFETEIRRGSLSSKAQVDFFSKCKMASHVGSNSIFEPLKKWLNFKGENLVKKGYAAIQKFVYDAWKSGVPIVTGTDTNAGIVISGFSFHDELKELAETGIPLQEVLRAATINAAALLQKKDLGVIRKGAIADLVLLDENPLKSIDATQKISGVILKGGYYSQKELKDSLIKVKKATEELQCTTAL